MSFRKRHNVFCPWKIHSLLGVHSHLVLPLARFFSRLHFRLAFPLLQDGTCVATASVPSSWFDYIRAPTRRMTVRYGLSSGGPAGASQLGVIQLNKRSPVSAIQRAVVIELPYRSLAAGDVVTVPVRANALYSVAAWQLRVQVDSRLSIVRATIDAQRWTAETTSPSPQVRLDRSCIHAC